MTVNFFYWAFKDAPLLHVSLCVSWAFLVHVVLECVETFWTNPQYRTTVTDPDDDDDENMGTLLIALMQKERRKKRKEGLDMLTVGYAVYKVNCFQQTFGNCWTSTPYKLDGFGTTLRIFESCWGSYRRIFHEELVE